MILSIIIPVYNEDQTIIAVLDKILNVELIGLEGRQIVIIDDNSTDETLSKIKKWKSSNPSIDLHIIELTKNWGKGNAVREGIGLAIGDFIIIQDADLEYDPKEYNKLLKPLKDGHADIVYGSRFVGGDPHRVLFFPHYLGNKFLTLLSNLFTGLNLTDMESGFKIFRSDIIKSISLKEKRFGFEPEITAKIARIKGIRIYEVGISYYGRTYQEGKKVNWKDGVRAIYCIIKYRFSRQ